MGISSIEPSGYSYAQPASQSGVQPAQQRQVLRAVNSVNQSGTLGENQLVFSVDRQTHRPVIRVENRETHEVVLQVPPQYVLNLAQNLGATSASTNDAEADT
jgi:uncharacterized FlaG/YvyC family protein